MSPEQQAKRHLCAHTLISSSVMSSPGSTSATFDMSSMLVLLSEFVDSAAGACVGVGVGAGG